jgi:hypothetical protein
MAKPYIEYFTTSSDIAPMLAPPISGMPNLFSHLSLSVYFYYQNDKIFKPIFPERMYMRYGSYHGNI